MTDIATNIEALRELANEVFEGAGNPDSPHGDYDFLLSTIETDGLTDGDAFPVKERGNSDKEPDFIQDIFSFSYDVVERRYGLHGSNDEEVQLAAHGMAYFLALRIAAQRVQAGVPTNG